MMASETKDPWQLEPSWDAALQPVLHTPQFVSLKNKLVATIAAGEVVYPDLSLLFKAFELCPLPAVKVVILGQDPYHGPGQAHGLSFSVPVGVKPPPSLKNIFKEIEADLGIPMPENGDLTRWASQGVLLLNSILSVRAAAAASHRKLGWEIFTDAVISTISRERAGVVFLLWGNFAIQKSSLIDASKHLILTAPHPSPLSAYQGWWGSRHFSKTNEWLINQGQSAIQW